MHESIVSYHESLDDVSREICELLAAEIDAALPESTSKLWHGHPVWFLEGNPVVGYRKAKVGVVLLFWSGRSFDEPGLAEEGSFMAAEARYEAPGDIDTTELRRWLGKARDIQWDYKNIVAKKGQLDRLK